MAASARAEDEGRVEERGVVIQLSRHRRSRNAHRRELWIAALALGALVALLLALARPFDARARTTDEPAPSLPLD